MNGKPEFSTDDELITQASSFRWPSEPLPANPVTEKPTMWHGRKFWNVKSEAEHKKLKAKRKAERVARRKTRRSR